MSITSDGLTAALVGIGGYGESYLPTLLNPPAGAGLKFVAGVDPFAGKSSYAAECESRGVPLFDTLAAMYEKVTPDLVILASPIQFHHEQTITALTHGSHVLCEKPLAATVEQALAMQAARDRAGREVAVGFQWSFCPVIHAFKADIQAGRFGKPVRLRTLVLWPRGESYYGRNAWAGRKYDSAGRPVFDSPANNAAAHFLHNMFYVLGDRFNTSVSPATVTAELYRANPIENYDTAAIRCVTAGGVPLLFVVSHATATHQGPVLSYEFEKATVKIIGDQLVAEFTDGHQHTYGSPCGAADPTKLLRVVEDLRHGRPTPCGIESALPHLRVIEAAAQSAGDVVSVPPDLVRIETRKGDSIRVIDGIAEVLNRCHAEDLLPSAAGAKWARAGIRVTL